MEKITSKDNKRIKRAYALKGKPSDGLFLVEGFHLVEMAFAHGCLKEAFALKPIDYLGELQSIVTEDIIKKLSTSLSPEGVVGVAKEKEPAEISSDRVLLLDRIQDPGNMGTLCRTALSFGFRDVIATPGSCSFFNPKAIQSSQGAIFDLNLHRMDGAAAVGLLKELGYRIVFTALDSSTPAEGFAFPKRICLGLGNEGQGMSDSLLALSDDRLRISMSGIDSLNVGVAGGILMHMASCQK